MKGAMVRKPVPSKVTSRPEPAVTSLAACQTLSQYCSRVTLWVLLQGFHPWGFSPHCSEFATFAKSV